MGNSDSKAKFRAYCVTLTKKPITQTRSAFWDEFWKLPSCVEDVFQMLSPPECRKILAEQPLNLAYAMNSALNILDAQVNQPKPAEYPIMLNCIRFLTRIMPFLMEGPNDSPLVEALLWGEGVAGVERLVAAAAKLAAEAEAEAGAEAAVEAGAGAEAGAQESTADASSSATAASESGEAAAAAAEAAAAASAEPAETEAAAEPSSTAATADGSTGAGDGGDAATPPPGDGESKGEAGSSSSSAAPLGPRLLTAMHRLCFMPDFTVPAFAWQTWRQQLGSGDGGLDSMALEAPLLWTGGLGQAQIKPGSPTLDGNRLEVLKLFLVTFSRVIYRGADSYQPSADPLLAEATSGRYPHTNTLFCSLINTALSYDPVGWGVPYAGSLAVDPAEALVDASLQLLGVLLDFAPPVVAVVPDHQVPSADHPSLQRMRHADADADADAAGQQAEGKAENKAEAEAEAEVEEDGAGEGVVNVYRELMFLLEGEEDFTFIFNGLDRLLNTVHESRNTYLPGSRKEMGCPQELMVLLWKVMDINKRFLQHVLRRHDVCRLVLPTLFMMHTIRGSDSHVGLVHICTFVLLMLSGERNFAVALNKPFTAVLATDLPRFDGSHVDLLIIVLHKLVVSGNRQLSSLYNCFLTVIGNISPYAHSLCLVSSLSLLKLFEIFSSPKFLFAQEQNHQYVFFLLDTLNNLLQYQYAGNQQLVYAIVRRKHVFLALHALQLPPLQPAAATAVAAAAATTQDQAEPAAAADAEPAVAESTAAAESEAEPAAAAEAEPAAAAEVEPAAAAGAEAEAESAAEAVPTGAVPEGGSLNPGAEGIDKVRVPLPPPARFLPTAEWLSAWKSRLPLATILRLLKFLVPQLEELCGASILDEASVLQFLKNTTMVGLLPVPHPIVIRKYQPNQYTNLWFTTYLWGIIFLRNQAVPLFDGSTIKLFTINLLSVNRNQEV